MIATKRLLLRRARMSDLEGLHQVFSHAEAMRHWDSLPFGHLDQTRGFLQGMVDAAGRDSDDFVVEHGGRAIGKAGAWCRDEVGIILHPDHWGQGLAKEALTAAIPHIFRTLGIARLRADIDPRNAASLHLFGCLGFVEVGRAARTIKVGEEWCDSVYLELPGPGADKAG